MKYILYLLFAITILASCTPQNQSPGSTSNIDYDKAFEFRDAQQPDSAFSYFNRAKDRFLQAKDSLGAGKCLVNMAIISTDKGDYFGGQEISLSALSYFDKDNKAQQVYLKSDYTNLGITSYNLGDYQKAVDFYHQALNYTTDSNEVLILENNIANAYRRNNGFRQSLNIYKRILNSKLGKTEYARTLANYEYTKWLESNSYQAAPGLLKALKIREEAQDLKGLNTGYAQLADYYFPLNTDSSYYFADKMYKAAKSISNPVDELEALKKLIKSSPYKLSKGYFNAYQRLNDSISNANTASKNQFALIRYESEKHKADNIALQKDNSVKRYQIAILILAIVFITIGGLIWQKKRKEGLEMRAQSSIREHQLKTSSKVHDVVANGLYRVMMEIANQGEMDKEDLLDKIEVLYEKSRDISYESRPFDDTNFHEKISGLLRSFATTDTKVLIIGNEEGLWTKQKTQAKFEIEHVMQELMVNMLKHSQAKNVVIRFEQTEKKLLIHYTDDGIGFQKNNKFKNGLKSTGNRMKNIRGAITFESEGRGLKVIISLPLT